ncbi:MAG: cyclic nucleotide-binding domain-containing protein [Deltaproteobacteria bacterium]|nr:MAG: cyclic nucleotide-binding domain-containing protein [Deltaproteobacteria bacterium]
MPDPLAPLIEGFTPRQVEQALDCFDTRVVHHGTPVMMEGDEGGSLIVVVDGELEIRTGDLELWTARAGEMVGEIGLFTRGLRTATVETNTEAELLVLTPEGYAELLARRNPVAARIEEMALQRLTHHLRRVDTRIAELAEGTVVAHHRPTSGFFGQVARLLGRGAPTRPPQVDVVSALSSSRLFSDSEPGALVQVAPAFQVEAWTGGAFLCTEGEVGDSLFLIVDGTVDVLIETHADKVEPVAVLGPGDAFGMAGIIDNRPRTASCVTHDTTVVLKLDRAGWTQVIADPHDAGRALRVAMIRSLADSLSYANAQIALLDLTSQAEDLTPLLMASAAVEAAPRAGGL